MAFCLPATLIKVVPCVSALILTALVALMTFYVLQEKPHQDEMHSGDANHALLLGLVILSAIVVLFFATFVVFSLWKPCDQALLPVVTAVQCDHCLR